jgi:hypothetical protein
VSSCALRIEFSAEVSKVSATTAALANVSVNGKTAKIVPASEITLLGGMGNGLIATTFAVWRDDLAPGGQYIVRVHFKLASSPSGGETGVAGARTLTVQMFSQ